MGVGFGPFVLDSARRQLFESGAEVHLSPKAFELLTALVEQRPRAVSKADLQARLWPRTFVQESNLSILVAEVRSALHDSSRRSRYIRTVHGFGYAFDAEVTVGEPAQADAPMLHSTAPASAVAVSEVAAATPPSETRPRLPMALRGAGALVAIALLAGGLAAAWRWPGGRPSPPAASMRLSIALPAHLPLASPGHVSPGHDHPALALSSDGRTLAYVCATGDTTQLCVRDMVSGVVTPLANTAGAHTPFFSPDGTQIGFFADAKLKRLPATGGEATVLAEAPYPWGAVWSPGGPIYFNRNEGEGIFAVPESGGPIEAATPGPAWMPELLPPGLLVSGGRYFEPRQPGRARKIPVTGRARYVKSGHLLYGVSGKLMAVPFDAAAMEVTGAPLSLADDLRSATYGVAQFSVSDEGTLVYAPGRPQGLASLVWVDRDGRTSPFGLPEGEFTGFALSPDGTRLAFSRDSEIWSVEVGSTDPPLRLSPRVSTGPRPANVFPRWTPDGSRVIYLSRTTANSGSLVSVLSDGSGQLVEVWEPGATGTSLVYPMGFTPDGLTLSVFGVGADGGYDQFLMRTDANGELVPGTALEPLLVGPFSQAFGQVSPDGRWMLFQSDISGTPEVYVTTYPKPGPVYKVSSDGGREAAWNPVRPEIIYMRGTSAYAVDVARGGEWRAADPHLLFTGAFPDSPGFGYDIASDGHLLMLQNPYFFTPVTTLTVITHVFDELRHRAPATGR